MNINLYYTPYPVQKFKNSKMAIGTARLLNPKSALTTLASGFRLFVDFTKYKINLKIIDMQVSKNFTPYKSILYGNKSLICYRYGAKFESIKQEIKAADIHIISSNFTYGAQIVADFVKYIKSINKESIVIVGGTDATARPYFYIDNLADFVIKGEGEYPLSMLIKALYDKSDFKNIDNICTKENKYNTEISYNNLVDLNMLLPMDLDLIDDIGIYTDTGEGIPPIGVKGPYICFETSRGCLQRCSFCTGVLRGKYRFMNPKAVKKHFEYFKRKGIQTILFQEDNILSRLHKKSNGEYLYPNGRAELIEIFKLAREYNFTWEFANGLEFGKLIDSDGCLDKELMDVLFWNEFKNGILYGCYRVQIPLENLGNFNTILFPKLIKFDYQIKILENIVKLGVQHITFNVIIGFVNDDLLKIKEYEKKCKYIKKHLLKLKNNISIYFNIFNLTLLPGTQDYKELNSKLKFNIDENPEMISVYFSAIDSNYLSFYELFQQRILLTKKLNGASVIDYDNIDISEGSYE